MGERNGGGGGGRRYVALLRGVNVSGHNPVAMKDLRALCQALPADHVETYLQSGNVVFRSAVADPERLSAAIEARIRSLMGLDVAVLVRSSEELDRVVAGNPFVTGDRDRSQLYVTFLATPPDSGRVAALSASPAASGSDAYRLGRREVYLSCPGGYGRTKLNNAFFERKLGVVATTRNWRTVTTLAQMAQG
ncbi:MAG: DUF1697 domain-containing protein [Actinomycetota bacterium]|nr:DUF1697 domain-containing protein [Actinomycetota bacterium]